MRRQIKSVLLAAGMSLLLAVPAYAHSAHSAAQNGGNGGMGSGMGTIRTEAYQGSTNYRANGAAPDNDVSVYGTETGNQFLNTNDGNTGRVGTNNYNGYSTNAATTTNNRGSSWGWLGLLGLLGFAGMRSRRPEGGRK